ncbi:MAG TPA: GNAT family N-acetyltransferase [Acidimicrobiales bacterium]|nr:GNAT family N-acetyltransferase [Acidimicrobiales bacterium]
MDVRGTRRYLRPIDRIELRRAGADDAATVAALHADSWRRHYRGAYSDAFLDGDVEADRKVVWSARLAGQDGGTSTILAEDNGEPVGFGHVVFDDDPVWGALVDNLHVTYRRKRSGIGTRLMAAAAAAVVGRGRGGLYLWVLEQNVAAQAFYDARGGRPADRRAVNPPGGVAGRLQGTPHGLRYVWSDPAVLVDGRSGT